LAHLVLDILPVAAEFRLASIEARALSTASRATTLERALASNMTPTVRTVEDDAVEFALARGEWSYQARAPEKFVRPLKAKESLLQAGWHGRTEAEIAANRGMYEGRFYLDMLQDESGKFRFDLLPDDMAKKLRELASTRGVLGFGNSPTQMEYKMTREFNPQIFDSHDNWRMTPPENRPIRPPGKPDPDDDLKP
jgi:hypothetical protein